MGTAPCRCPSMRRTVRQLNRKRAETRTQLNDASHIAVVDCADTYRGAKAATRRAIVRVLVVEALWVTVGVIARYGVGDVSGLVEGLVRDVEAGELCTGVNRNLYTAHKQMCRTGVPGPS